MQIESCGDPFAQSSAGAMGLFQVMPYHFDPGEDPYNPKTNALRGLDYLSRALAARDGVVRYGLAGYNGGITGAKRAEYSWPAETQRYVYWGTGIYDAAVEDLKISDRLDEWMARGGSSLCQQAAERLGIDQ
jgi:soluble lytic murein transglycosylase-like protein